MYYYIYVAEILFPYFGGKNCEKYTREVKSGRESI